LIREVNKDHEYMMSQDLTPAKESEARRRIQETEVRRLRRMRSPPE
jgi:hypothetical protein